MKSRRKPIPLALDSSPEYQSNYNGKTVEHSIALQDAAVQSATSLMAVMNDMLRSPHVSAHLHKRSTSLQPMHGRPRSHTAPSTPLAEASFPDPVELPGCPPLDQHLRASLERAVDGKSVNTTATASTASIGQSIERPHTSPQESVHPLVSKERSSLESSGPREHHVQYPFSPDSYRTPASHDLMLYRHGPPLAGESGDATPTGAENSALHHPRPSLSVLQPPQLDNHAEPLLRASLPAPRRPSVSATDGSGSHALLYGDEGGHADIESMVLEQLSSMRASHGAHIASLKVAHDKEIESLRIYIEFLEKHHKSRHTLPAAAAVAAAPRALTLDTSTTSKKLGGPLTSDPSTAIDPPFESPIENLKRSSQESNAETESLRRKLSLLRKVHSESTETRRERDHLRDSLDRSDRRILQLKDIVRKAKENEKALRNATEDLKHQLQEANNERVDVREGLHEACVQVRKLTERDARLSRNAQAYQMQLRPANASYTSLLSTHSDQTHYQSKHSRTRSDMSLNVWSQDPLLAQVRQLQRACREKDTRLEELEASQTEQSRATEARIEKLERTGQVQVDQLTAAEADRDRYESLLRKEIRRRTRLSILAQDTEAVPEIEAEASNATREKLANIHAECAISGEVSATASDSSLDPRIALLEKEVMSCMSEIIMYKLDVAGYRKDLKKANAEIELLKSLDTQQPPLTPDRSSTSSTASRPSRVKRRPSDLELDEQTSASGLGISVAQAPKTPTRARAAIAAAAEGSSTNTALAVPAMSPKTPSNIQKKLPRTPVTCTPSPLPRHSPTLKSLQRGETLRSLSESIISSYTKRTPPVAEVTNIPRRHPRSSDPVGAAPLPLSVRLE